MMTRMKDLSLLLVLAFCAGALRAQTHPIPVKVVVLAMFEQGEDTGDTPGEYQYWVERDHLDRVYPLPAGYHAARMNADGELAIERPGEAEASPRTRPANPSRGKKGKF